MGNAFHLNCSWRRPIHQRIRRTILSCFKPLKRRILGSPHLARLERTVLVARRVRLSSNLFSPTDETADRSWGFLWYFRARQWITVFLLLSRSYANLS